MHIIIIRKIILDNDCRKQNKIQQIKIKDYIWHIISIAIIEFNILCRTTTHGYTNVNLVCNQFAITISKHNK